MKYALSFMPTLDMYNVERSMEIDHREVFVCFLLAETSVLEVGVQISLN